MNKRRVLPHATWAKPTLPRTALLTAIGLLCTSLAACSSDGEDSAGADSLTVGILSVQGTEFLQWAEAEKYFDDEDLDLSISQDGPALVPNLVAGKSDLVIAPSGSALAVVNEGKPLSIIYDLSAGSQAYVVASKPEIKSPADCSSVTTGVPGMSLYAWTIALEKSYDADWELVQGSNDPSVLITNVVSGRTDCAVGGKPFFSAAIDKGELRVVFDPSDTTHRPADWPSSDGGVEGTFATLPDTVDSKRAAFEKFMTAVGKAAEDYKAADSSDIAKTLVEADDIYAEFGEGPVTKTVETSKLFLAPNDGYITEQIWSDTLTFLEASDLAFLAEDPSKFGYGEVVDMSIYEAAIGTP